MYKFYILIIIWMFGHCTYAQKYTNYTINNGLPSNHIYAILQDANGFMWFLTDKGMVKYNGHTFKTFTTKDGLPNNDVWEAFDTPDHKVWYMSKSSALGYIENDSVFSFSNSVENEVINPLFSVQLGNDVYPTGPSKTYALINGKWESILSNKRGRQDQLKIHHSKVNDLRVDYRLDSIYVLDKNEQIVYKTGVKGILTGGKRGQVTEHLYYWLSKDDYTIFNLETFELTQFKLKDEIGIEDVEHVRLNNNDDRIQLTGKGFIAFLDEKLHAEQVFYFPPELDAHFGYIDRSNTLWLATFNNGVYKLPFVKRNVKYINPESKIQTFDRVNQELIVGVYNKGFFKYNEESQTLRSVIKDAQFIYGANEILEIKSTFYSTFKNVFIESEKQQYVLNTDKSYNDKANIVRELVYYKHSLYGVFSFGVNKMNSETFTLEESIYQKGTRDIIVFKNRLIVAAANGIKEVVNDSIVEVVEFPFSKPVQNLTKINDSTLLVNTDGFGSYITDLKTIYPIKESAFLSVQDAFVEDQNVWLATNIGVLKLSFKKGKYTLERRYTKEEGLPTNNVNTVYVNQSELIVGTNNGMAILPKEPEHISLLLDVYIKDASYNHTNLLKDDSELKYQENSITSFTVSNIDFSDNEAPFVYTYKLEPIQNEWTTITSSTFNFNDLSPDQYIFRLQTKTGEKTLHFTIHPLFWQTLWFQSLILIAFVGSIVFVTTRLFKVSQKKRTQALIQKRQFSDLQLKALRSQMNPHFVFNALSAIQYYISTNNFEASEMYLVKFSKLIRQYFELSREQEISLDVEVKLLTNYLDLEKLRFKEKLEYRISIDSTLELFDVTIPTMLLQPIVENAVNHGIFNKKEKGEVRIDFKKQSEYTCLVTIIDNGVGFKNTQKMGKQPVTSSEVLTERLLFLNQSGHWEITYHEEEMYPELEDKGNKSTFLITRIFE